MHHGLRDFVRKRGGWHKRGRRRSIEGDTTFVRARIERFAEALCLLRLRRGPAHGYELGEYVAADGFDDRADVGNLYRLLRGLEGEGLVRSEWSDDTARPRRMYRLTEVGTKALDAWAASLSESQEVIDHFLRRYRGDASVAEDDDGRG
jgi:PadR family transcriptional regulator, regulatory protein PadR